MFAHDALTNGKKNATFDFKNAFVNANLILIISYCIPKSKDYLIVFFCIKKMSVLNSDVICLTISH